MLAFYARLFNQILSPALGRPLSKPPGQPASVVHFACWPQDTAESFFDHCNNSNHSRFGDLARYRILAESGMLQLMIKENMNWIIAEQMIAYSKPIRMFQRFEVVTTAKEEGNKWVHFTHAFEDRARGVTLTRIEVKAVMKKADGKTVKPSELAALSPYFKELLSA